MPRIVAGSQPLRKAVLNPMSSGSRVISCAAYIKAPVTQAFGVTFPVGLRTWLQGIQVWFDPHLWGAADWIQFKVISGTGVPSSHAEAFGWENVLPILYESNTAGLWGRYVTFEPYKWEMNQLFGEKGRRFGVAVEASPLVTPIWCTASFRISEG